MYLRRIAWMSVCMFLVYFGGQEVLAHTSDVILDKKKALAHAFVAQALMDQSESNKFFAQNNSSSEAGSGVESGSKITEEKEFPIFPYKRVYIISAYYSPLLSQEHYATGSYEGDVRLNGDGVLSADNSYVYPGMIAAPSSIPFGTKIEIPGLGIGAVHDRGGAILAKDESGDLHDRLDVWMGFGDDGLDSALEWGRRTLEVTVYGLDDAVEENFHLDTISSGLGLGSEGKEVSELQNNLQSLGYSVRVSGLFDEATQSAVLRFQQDRGILKFESELGAGYFGPTTHVVLERVLHEKRFDPALNTNGLKNVEENVSDSGNMSNLDTVSDHENVDELQTDLDLLSKYPDLSENLLTFDNPLSLGDSGENVRQLQEELKKLGYFGIESTGYLGATTEHAIFKFQQAVGIVKTMTDQGAGVIGPKTREVINTLLSERRKSKRSIALKRSERTNRFLVQNDLFVGDSGNEVKNLQLMLKKLGFFHLEPTEYYGEETQKAVLQFQLVNNIVSGKDDLGAGRVGPKTRDTLKKIFENNYLAYSQ